MKAALLALLLLVPVCAFAATAEEVHALYARGAYEQAAQAGETSRSAAGLATAARGAKLLPADKAKALHEWRSGTYRRWSEERQAAGDYDGSLKVLAAGLADMPGNRDLQAGVAYHTQEALAGLPEAKAAEHFKAIRAAFPNDKGVQEAGTTHAHRGVIKLAEAGKFAEAVKLAVTPAPPVVATELMAEITS